ncbi:hypothetical protein [Marilutibacter maris]|uniref:Uncharacterized protein n=1 Tax=Marilutibacter maris TaxID=1605891 RepID=A0A507ZSN2_9GAMM|nr:hypothetical protein [Lysobacter maris]KAB8162441.1 hypothetical protein FKV24_018280 [Lysobacter maris]
MTHMRPHPALLALAIAVLATACKPETAPEPAGAEPAAQAAEATMPEAGVAPSEAAQAGEVDGMAAQMQGSGMAMAAQVGGSMHAAAELCGHMSAAQLEQAKQGQMLAFTQTGGSEADFEAAYDNGYNEAKAKLEGVSGAEREQACREMAEMSAAAAAMQQ